MRYRFASVACCAVLTAYGVACGDDVDPTCDRPDCDAGSDAETGFDAGPTDGGSRDGGRTDAPIDSDSGPPSTSEAGRAHFVLYHRSGLDPYTRDPSAAEQAWMREHYWRIYAYSSYFDSRTSWYPDAWVYRDAYAIYDDGSLATEHPEWILRDASDSRLYIPFACSGGTCPQYAGDFGNPDFRAHWIAEVAATLTHPYRGLMVDDVNLDWRVGDGAGDRVIPIDPRTGVEMTLADWRRYFAVFMEEVRAAFPDREIIHNALWFVDDSDPFVSRQLRAADFILLERGIVDSGITGGTGRYSFESFLAYVERRHAHGTAVLFFADDADTAVDCEYNLASYFLVSGGMDGTHCDHGDRPDDWWELYDVDLGEPIGPFTRDGDLYLRDFERGMTIVNPPESSPRTFDLGGSYIDASGGAVTSVTLDAATGQVLRLP